MYGKLQLFCVLTWPQCAKREARLRQWFLDRGDFFEIPHAGAEREREREIESPHGFFIYVILCDTVTFYTLKPNMESEFLF